MKVKKYLILVALSILLLAELSGSTLAFAENLPDQQVITAENHQEISGRYTVNFENDELLVTFAPDSQLLVNEAVQGLNLQVGQGSEKVSFPFSQVQAGLYEVRVSKNVLQAKPKLAIQLQTISQKEYIFENLAYQLPKEEVTKTDPLTTTSMMTTSQTQETTSSTTVTTSTETLVTTNIGEASTQAKPEPGQYKEASTSTDQRVILRAQEGNGKFDVSLTNVNRPLEVSSIQVAVWSEKNGQDDLRWYPMTLSQSSGKLTVDIKQHSNQSDNYIVHVYVYYKSSPAVGIDAGKIAITKPAAKNQLNAKFTNQGLQVTLASNQVSDYKKVRFAIWGEKNGQDDLKWHAASSNGSLVVPYKNLAGFDKYQVHAYLEGNGQLIGITTTSVNMELPSVTSTVTKTSGATYKIEIKNVPDYVTSLQVPVWSEKNGQDDLKWYAATRKASGTYEVMVQLSNHSFDTGKYNAHIYANTSFNKQIIGLAVVNHFQVGPLGPPSATIQIANINTQTLRFDVIVSNVVAPSGLKFVQVPVWSESNGQDDIQWYKATKQENGSFKVTVSIANHKYSFGRYHAHAYLVQGNNQMVGVGTTSVYINQPANITKIQAAYQGMGNYQLTMAPVLTSGRVKFAVWSEVGGQDDLRWYDGYRQQSVVFGGGFNAQYHSGTGLYHIHAYEDVNGQMRGLGTTTIHVARSHYQAPYYSQLDPRWSGIRYGAWTFGPSGCVPTSMAMIISAITNQTVSPVQVANYLYYNTLEYNRSFFGTSSRGVVMSARNWGLKASALNSYNALETALKQGYYVAAGVGPSKYVVFGGHEIVLKGYQNGMTYVLDPYNPGNNGWTSLAYIWSIPSRDPIDRTEGMPYIRISD